MSLCIYTYICIYIKYNEGLGLELCITRLVLGVCSKANINKIKLYNYHLLKTGKKVTITL